MHNIRQNLISLARSHFCVMLPLIPIEYQILTKTFTKPHTYAVQGLHPTFRTMKSGNNCRLCELINDCIYV